jgi:hypothetical protein
MNSTRTLLAAAALMLAAPFAQAQVANCTAAGSEGTLSAPSSTVVMPTGFTIPPSLSGYSAGLPNADFAVVDPNDIVFNEDSTISGARFLDANTTGAFSPANYGLGAGDDVCVLYVTYDLGIIRAAVDEILNGSFLFTPCCAIIPTFVPDIGDICAALNSAGIFGPGDVNDLNDVFALVIALGGSPSFEALQNTIDVEINPLIASGTPCTGSSLLCYTFTNRICYTVGAPACSSAVTPGNQSHTVLSNRVQLDWDPQPGAVACQVQGKRLPTGPSPSVNILGGDISTTNVPFTVAGAGTTWTWRVRCACSVSPLDVSGFSAYGDTFNIPLARQADRSVDLTGLFPNPASDQVTLTFEADAAGSMPLVMSDMLGRTVLSRTVSVNEGINRVSWNLPALSAGLYLVQVGDGDAQMLELKP